jgi:hypothetical protein
MCEVKMNWDIAFSVSVLLEALALIRSIGFCIEIAEGQIIGETTDRSVTMSKQNENEVRVTTYDKLMRAWQNSMEMAREFRVHSQEMKESREDGKAGQIFAEFAETEGLHAARLRDLLLEHQNKK